MTSEQTINHPLHSYRKINPGRFAGELTAPPSKSESHRLLILAALSGKSCTVENLLFSGDIQITLEGLKRMGYVWKLQGDSVYFTGERLKSGEPVELDFGNSGTSARLLTAVAAITPGRFQLTGSQRMNQRPMLPLLKALEHLGVSLQHHTGYLPVKLEGGPLNGGTVSIDASQSSQFLSALMLIAPLTTEGLVIKTEGTVASESYLELTADLMRKSGLGVKISGEQIEVPGNQDYHPKQLRVAGDYSSIAYFAAGAAISGGEVTLRGLSPDSVQGDRVIFDILKDAGARIIQRPDGYTLFGEELRAVEVDMHHCPDLVPTVAVVALFCRGTSRIRNVEHLQYKESNRIQALISNIENLGGSCVLAGKDLIVQPEKLHGGLIRTFNDHRIAMSFSLVGLKVRGINIENPDCVRKSYPDFWQHFERLHKSGA